MSVPKKKQSQKKKKQRRFASWLSKGREKMLKAINLGKSILRKPKSFLKKKGDEIVSTEPVKDINSVSESESNKDSSVSTQEKSNSTKDDSSDSSSIDEKNTTNDP